MDRDLRLYTYGHGTLRKFGRSKSKINNSQRHFFTDIDQLRGHVHWLQTKGYKGLQFVIVEYIHVGATSKILEIIE